MPLLKPLARDNGIVRNMQLGDVLSQMENFQALATVGAGTILAPMLVSSLFNRTGPTGAYVDTTDTASNIINYIASFGSGDQTGDTWRFRFVNTVAFACTFTGGTGVTIVNPTVNASSVKDFLVQVTSAAPQTTVGNASQTNASAVITGMTLAQTNAISIGQLVTGTSIPANAYVIGIQSGVGVTISANATATIAPNALTFSPSLTITGIGQGLL